MAELEPADLFQYGIPVEGALADAGIVRNAFTALARTFYTTDDAKPADKRNGQLRVNASNPNNVRIQVYLSGDWRTVLQNVQVDIPAPVKQVVEVATAAAAWTIDHNLGTQPLVQVYDDQWRLLRQVPANVLPNQERALGFVPEPVLTGATGTIAAFRPAFDGFVGGLYASVAEAITGSPDQILDLVIAGTPVTGGVVSINAPHGSGTLLEGSTVTGDNAFSAGDLIELRLQTTAAPTAGSLNTAAVVRPADIFNLLHVNENRITINHPAARTGFVVLVG